MPQSLSFNLVHIIFTTKNRRPLLGKELCSNLYPYMAQIARDKRCECYRIGGIVDHVHLAVRLAPVITASKLISEVKTGSSRWLKKQAPQLHDFAWQEGYASFSASPKGLDALIGYIDNQEAHHKKVSYQDELRKFFKQYGVEFDERYVWD